MIETLLNRASLTLGAAYTAGNATITITGLSALLTANGYSDGQCLFSISIGAEDAPVILTVTAVSSDVADVDLEIGPDANVANGGPCRVGIVTRRGMANVVNGRNIDMGGTATLALGSASTITCNFLNGSDGASTFGRGSATLTFTEDTAVLNASASLSISTGGSMGFTASSGSAAFDAAGFTLNTSGSIVLAAAGSYGAFYVASGGVLEFYTGDMRVNLDPVDGFSLTAGSNNMHITSNLSIDITAEDVTITSTGSGDLTLIMGDSAISMDSTGIIIQADTELALKGTSLELGDFMESATVAVGVLARKIKVYDGGDAFYIPAYASIT